MALLERDLPLTSLADYADEARRGGGRVVLVSGEAGIGKSALLEEFAAGLSDARWCWGACDGLFTPLGHGQAGRGHAWRRGADPGQDAAGAGGQQVSPVHKIAYYGIVLRLADQCPVRQPGR